jgi:hypothetical protein
MNVNIIELKITNFRRISAVRIRPNGALVEIKGVNASGKTSTLSAIWAVMLGKAATPAHPIRAGEEEAVITCDLGEYKITRSYTRVEGRDYTMTLKITEKDGTPVRKQQQAVLDSLIGAIAFDPLAFARMKPKDQFDMMKGLVTGYDWAAKEAERKQLYEDRTSFARRAKENATLAAGVELPPGGKPAAVSAADIGSQLAAATSKNAAIERERASLQRQADDASAKEDEAERLRARAEQLESEAARMRKTIETMAPLEPPVDTTALVATMTDARSIDRIRGLFDDRQRYEDAAESFQSQADDCTRRIEAIDREKMAAIAKANIPVPKLTFGDDEILYDGLKFEEAATSIKIRTSVALGIALNPKLRVMTIDEGSELDSQSLELLAKLAEANDYQIWLARLDESGAGDFVITDGHLAEKEKRP